MLYGAIEGECYLRGVGGERFGVRNSGAFAWSKALATMVREYMTGGCLVVLGADRRELRGRYVGGVAYVHDPNGRSGTAAICPWLT